MSMSWQAKHSQLDASVNFSKSLGSSIVECRFVQREEHQIIVYLSSHAGCLQACRFCHLTATGQTDETPVDEDLFVEQLQTVIKYWQTIRTGKETHINLNWMARGEPLNNPTIVDGWDSLINRLQRIIEPFDLQMKANISTIMPRVYQAHLVESFSGPIKPILYYSLYSLNPMFRRRWLPKAQNVEKSINELKAFIAVGGQIVVHQAFIRNENDSPQDITELVDFLHQHVPTARINTVRYNSFSDRHGEESENLDDIQRQFLDQFNRVQLVPRVGFDAAASCGMFLNVQI